MATEKPKQHQPPGDADQGGKVPLEERDLEPRKEQSEKIRGGLEPPNGFRSVYAIPPQD